MFILTCVLNNNKMILDLFEEEEDENNILRTYLNPNKRKATNVLFKSRVFEILINRHLLQNETVSRVFSHQPQSI